MEEPRRSDEEQNEEPVGEEVVGEEKAEIHFQKFTVNQRSYLFSVRKMNNGEGTFLVITEKRTVRNQEYTHRLRIYHEMVEQFAKTFGSCLDVMKKEQEKTKE